MFSCLLLLLRSFDIWRHVYINMLINRTNRKKETCGNRKSHALCLSVVHSLSFPHTRTHNQTCGQKLVAGLPFTMMFRQCPIMCVQRRSGSVPKNLSSAPGCLFPGTSFVIHFLSVNNFVGFIFLSLVGYENTVSKVETLQLLRTK